MPGAIVPPSIGYAGRGQGAQTRIAAAFGRRHRHGGQCSLQTRGRHSGLPAPDGGNHPILRHSPGHRRCPAVSSSSQFNDKPRHVPQQVASTHRATRPHGSARKLAHGPKPAAREIRAHPQYSATKALLLYISPPTVWPSGREWPSCTRISADQGARKAGNCRAAPHGVRSQTMKPPPVGAKWPLWTHASFRGPFGCYRSIVVLPSRSQQVSNRSPAVTWRRWT